MVTNKNLPRSIRNNNPGNLRLTAINWKGKVPKDSNTDKSFEQFTSPVWGFRAMAMDIINDVKKGKNTPLELIKEYAPASDGNNTLSYATKVAASIGVGVNQLFTKELFINRIPFILHTIHKVEAGKEYFSLAQITDFYNQFKLDLK